MSHLSANNSCFLLMTEVHAKVPNLQACNVGKLPTSSQHSNKPVHRAESNLARIPPSAAAVAPASISSRGRSSPFMHCPGHPKLRYARIDPGPRAWHWSFVPTSARPRAAPGFAWCHLNHSRMR
jgi:hypothetical protein